MTDRYRIADPPAPAASAPDRPATSGAGRLRPALWLLLILTLAANAAASTLGATPVSIVFGAAALACAAGLVADHYRRRRGQ